jgi:hypothetical protein
MRFWSCIGMAMLVGPSACAVIQPSSKGAPIADTVGAVLAAGATGAAVAAYKAPDDSPGPFTQDHGYTAGVVTLGALACLYTFSALYGFSQDPATQTWKEPIRGLQVLALGLMGFASGVNGYPAPSTGGGGGGGGCCSWHGGVARNPPHEGPPLCTTDGRTVCEDGWLDSSCPCP